MQVHESPGTSSRGAKQCLDVLHESGSKLFCTMCNIVVEKLFSRKTHLEWLKHRDNRRDKSILTEADPHLFNYLLSILSAERIKLSLIK